MNRSSRFASLLIGIFLLWASLIILYLNKNPIVFFAGIAFVAAFSAISDAFKPNEKEVEYDRRYRPKERNKEYCR